MVDWARRSYLGRTAFLVTMHGKKRAIAPPLREGIGLNVTPSPAIDTDQFGTFSGELPRSGSALDAARAKIAAGFARMPGATIGLASEGSFGPDPSLPFVPISREIVLFFDQETGLEIIGTATDQQPNFQHAFVSDAEEAAAFADRVGFPEHGVIVCGGRDGKPYPEGALFKEITDLEGLRNAVACALTDFETAFLQTDMRAHRNPTRMKSIREATRDLVRRVLNRCPSCHCPGYAISERVQGLPCAWCSLPTRLVQSEILKCQDCGHHEERRALGPDRADPALCDNCNP
jgi:hypothetical protein